MIVFFHLYNDNSGSPRVLSSAISALKSSEDDFYLFLGSDGDGCLSQVDIPIIKYWYRRGTNRLVTLCSYFVSQLCLFFRLLRTTDLPGDAILYINTLLPFAAAVFGKLTGRVVVYHLHEVSISPKPLRWFLTGIARFTARHLIYVSESHRKCLPIGNSPASTVYNVLDEKFFIRAKDSVYKPRRDAKFNVLMLASLRDYKGIPELLVLTKRLEGKRDICFNLVVNGSLADIVKYFVGVEIPSNLLIHPQVEDTSDFYSKASLVLNLSRPDQWIETFGLTLLEAMAYGIPVIVPPVGGPTELVENGVEGFMVDCRDSCMLEEKVLQLSADESLCMRLSNAARRKAACFSFMSFSRALRYVISSVREEGRL